MEDNNNSALFSFDSPLSQPSYIKVIGVGGGGNNAVNHMFRKGISGVDFIVSNTDMKALNGSPVPTKFVLGKTGLGAGGRPEKARKAAEEKAEEIKQLFSDNTKMIFITAGMGGGTGTGAAPVIARLAKEIKLQAEDDDDPGQILVVAVVTTPFMFEGNRRLQQAQAGVEELSKYVDSILVINNEKLRSYGNLCLNDAFSMANDVLLTAVKGIAEIITLNAYVNIDFRDVNTVMEHSGTAIMGIGVGKGENRARQAVEEAATSVLLNDSNIAGAKNVLLYFSYGPDHEITMDEMGEVADYITERTGSRDTNVIWGTGTDDTLTDEVKITLIATGFEQSKKEEPSVILLKDDQPKGPTPAPQPATPIDEMTLIHRDAPETATTPEAVTTPEPVTAYVAPVVTTVDTVVPDASPAGETVASASGRHVINLYDDEPQQKEPIPEVNPFDDIRIVSRAPEATIQDPQPTVPAASPAVNTAAPAPTNTFAPLHTNTIPTSALDNEARARAERIKHMHDLLRNNVNGAQIVESMDPVQLTGERLYELTHSSVSDVSRTYLDSDGNIKKNPELFETHD